MQKSMEQVEPEQHLIYAIENDMPYYFIKSIVDIIRNINYGTSSYGDDKNPLLLLSLRKHNDLFKIMKLLIRERVDVNTKDQQNGSTALINFGRYLTYHNYAPDPQVLQCIKLLCRNCADVNITDNKGHDVRKYLPIGLHYLLDGINEDSPIMKMLKDNKPLDYLKIALEYYEIDGEDADDEIFSIFVRQKNQFRFLSFHLHQSAPAREYRTALLFLIRGVLLL